MKTTLFLSIFLFLLQLNSFAQFGRNKVQYKNFDWYYIQTTHFDIYFSLEGDKLAEFTAKAAEDALRSIERKINFRINNRITIILYNSQNDFQETNVIDQYLSEGIGGFTELFKNRVVLPFTGSYKDFRHVIHHELVHAVMNDMFYGGSIQNVIANNISIRFPLWFSEGMAEYLSLGWDTNTDMFIRDAATSEYLPDIPNLDNYFAYRGGQSVIHYIATKYGEEKVGELMNRIKSKGNVEEGFKASIGLDIKELNERWKKEIKREYWPEIAFRKDPDEFAKRLTDHRKDGGFFNTSPALSPAGDKIAFISNRDFYFDVYLMDASDGKILKRLVKGNRSADFEELNILTPGLSWSPDGKKIALSAKSSGADVLYIIDAETGRPETIPFRFEGITNVSWSPTGRYIALSGHNTSQSDIYVYDFETNTLNNITEDIFTDLDPAWSPDETKLFFVSDRKELLAEQLNDYFRMAEHDYAQTDIYYYDFNFSKIFRVTDTHLADEGSPVVSADGKEILYVSDENGINNIYKKRLYLAENDTVTDIVNIKPEPITNSLNGLNQISISRDGKKLAFSSMYQAAYNIFIMSNPFESKTDLRELTPTPYRARTLTSENKDITSYKTKVSEKSEKDTTLPETGPRFFSGSYIDSVTTKEDSARSNYSSFIFGQKDYAQIDTSAREDKNFLLTDNLDSSGNFRVNKYKITFSPDLVYANAGYSTLYGLLGTTVISFSDVLGNHRLVGVTSLQIDLKNSDYGLAYYYLPKRYGLGVEAFHTARFVFLQRGNSLNLFRFRNYGAVVSANYPLNRFYRFEGGLSLLNVSSENLDNTLEEARKITYFIPTVSFVHDNSIWGYTSPIDGTRYRFDFFGNPLVQADKYGFYSVLGDYRTYFKFWTDYSFGFRFSGGYSWGKNPQRFFLGGVENWINRRFATGEIPIDSPADFAFLTSALPMRGFDYAERIGTKYALTNIELRFPLIRYLLTGALPILFRDVLGVAFIDLGSAWNQNKQLQLFSRNESGSVVSKDLLMGTGLGARIFFLYFLLRFDVAWSYNVDSFSRPIFYFSLGADF